MNRLQQKCVIASAGLHLSLVLVLFVGPAFLSHKNADDNLPILDFIPVKTVDALVSGGGNPNGRVPEAPAPTPPTPPTPRPPTPPPPETHPLPDPRKPPTPEVRNDDSPDSSLIPSPKKPKRPEVSTKLVRRPPSQTNDNTARDEQRAREYAETRRRAADALGKAADRIESGISSGTSIELKGPGGGGLPYANFLQAVKSRYSNAWVVPDGVTDDEATATASVTIARDGTVISHRIIHSSGSPAVDQSVQVVLERVKVAAPLPDGAKEDQRTVTINFNVKAKKSLG
jgi:colicin import membrane protein